MSKDQLSKALDDLRAEDAINDAALEKRLKDQIAELAVQTQRQHEERGRQMSEQIGAVRQDIRNLGNQILQSQRPRGY